MQVSVKKLGGLERQLTISIPAEQFQKKFDERVQKFAKKAKIDGFRAGKIPAKVIEQRYGDGLREEIGHDLVQSSFAEAVKQEDLKPAAYPTIDIKQSGKEGDFEYTATFEVYPELKLKDFSKISLEKMTAEVTDSDIDEMIENLRKQRQEWEKVDRACKIDDRVKIDFEGFIKDKPFEGNKAEKIDLVLGSKMMIPGFEEEIVGAKPGEELEIKVTFPKDYQKEEFAGKKAVFKIKVHEVSEPKLPEVNEEFLKQFGITEGGVEKLRSELRTAMERELETMLRSLNKRAVMDKLLEVNKIDMPKSMIESEMDHLAHQAHEQMKQYLPPGQSLPETPRENFQEEATRHVALGLMIGDYIQQYEMKADPKRVQDMLEHWASMHNDPQQLIQAVLKDRQQMAQLEMLVIEDQVVDKLLESAKVKEKVMKYQDVMKERFASR